MTAPSVAPSNQNLVISLRMIAATLFEYDALVNAELAKVKADAEREGEIMVRIEENLVMAETSGVHYDQSTVSVYEWLGGESLGDLLWSGMYPECEKQWDPKWIDVDAADDGISWRFWDAHNEALAEKMSSAHSKFGVPMTLLTSMRDWVEENPKDARAFLERTPPERVMVHSHMTGESTVIETSAIEQVKFVDHPSGFCVSIATTGGDVIPLSLFGDIDDAFREIADIHRVIDGEVYDSSGVAAYEP